MKAKYLIPAIVLLAACGGDDTASQAPASPYEQQAIERGRADAQKAIDASDGSLDRENAILNIRETEQKLYQAGDSLAAKAYIEAAKAALQEAKIIN